jgi:NAD(P) transhydrogenase subunit alpha
MIRVGILRESYQGERRVALTPKMIPVLREFGGEVRVESGAGEAAGFGDDAYAGSLAQIVSRDEASSSDVLLQVRTPAANPVEGRKDFDRLHEGQVIIGLADPLSGGRVLHELAARSVTLFALELLPRIARAQEMDVMTSMASLAGYKAVLMAADALPRVFPMMITAAGTLAPARVLVVGAGVAGLQAIATARRLGALVLAYDIRPEVKEEVESVGGTFVTLPLAAADASDERGYARALGESFYAQQRAEMGRVVAQSNVVITTASVPGRSAPKLVTREMVESMSRGSVIVDLAAPSGGNCELTKPDQAVEHRGVFVLGPTNVPAEVAFDASQLYARNVTAFLRHLIVDGVLRVSLGDPITRETLVMTEGKIVHPRVLAQLEEGRT